MSDPSISALERETARLTAVAYSLLDAEKALFEIAASLCRTQEDADRLKAWADRFVLPGKLTVQ